MVGIARIPYLFKMSVALGNRLLGEFRHAFLINDVISNAEPKRLQNENRHKDQCSKASYFAQSNWGTLEPVDRAEEVPLADRYAAMTKDVVGRRHEEEEIR